MGALASRGFQTSAQVQDVDSAAKFIGAGAATVGVAGTVHRNKVSGTCVPIYPCVCVCVRACVRACARARTCTFVVGSSIARQDQMSSSLCTHIDKPDKEYPSTRYRQEKSTRLDLSVEV